MLTQNGQSLWQSVFFIVATMGVGLAFPYLLPFVVLILILGGRWVLRQPERTPIDILLGQFAILMGSVVIIFGVLALGLVFISARGYTTSSVTTMGMMSPPQVQQFQFSPEETSEPALPDGLLPDPTPSLG